MPLSPTCAILIEDGYDDLGLATLLQQLGDASETLEIGLFSADGGPCRGRLGLEARTLSVDEAASPDAVIVALPEASQALRAPFAKHIRYWMRQGRPGLLLAPGAGDVPEPLSEMIVCQRLSALPAKLSALLGALGMTLAGSKDADIGPVGRPAPLERALACLEDAWESPLTIPALAEKVGISQRQLERLFASYLGRSPNQVQRRMRLDRARELLLGSADRIAEIALKTGFSSPVHFSRAYRSEFGLSPQQDRMKRRHALRE